MKVEIIPTSEKIKVSLPNSNRAMIRAHTTNEMEFYLTLKEARQLINKMWNVLDGFVREGETVCHVCKLPKGHHEPYCSAGLCPGLRKDKEG